MYVYYVWKVIKSLIIKNNIVRCTSCQLKAILYVKAIVYGYVHESPQNIYLSIYINSEILILIRRMPTVHKIELHEIDECPLLFSWRTIMPPRNAES